MKNAVVRVVCHLILVRELEATRAEETWSCGEREGVYDQYFQQGVPFLAEDQRRQK